MIARMKMERIPRRQFSLATLVLFTAPTVLFAQTLGKYWRIGVLTPASSKTNTHYYRALVDGLRELGLVEGKNITIEWRFGEGANEGLFALAQDLVRLKVDVMVVNSTPGVRAALQASNTIPIVMAVVGDPVSSGFAASLARPGGTVTGTSISAADVAAKQFELLREVSPKWTRFAALLNSTNSFHAQILKELQAAASKLRVHLAPYGVHDPSELEPTLSAMVRERVQAAVVAPDPFFRQQADPLTELFRKFKLASMLPTPELVESGGLMSYGQNYTEHFRRAATFVSKILNGANPADLPIELPTRFDLVINMKTAKAINLVIPRTVLMRADRIIE